MRCMKRLLMLLLAPAIFTGCLTTKNAERKETAETTNSNVEVRYEKVFVHDTAYIEIPAQTAERTTQDSISHLENDFAVSEVEVKADGILFHSLKTKPQKMPVQVDKEIERKDSIVYVNRYVEVPVERTLNRWEKTCIKWFPYTLATTFVLVYVIVWLLRKRQR